MNRKMLYATLILLSLTVRTAYTGDLLDGGPMIDTPANEEMIDTPADRSKGKPPAGQSDEAGESATDEFHRRVTGEIDRVEDGMISLKTEEGTVRKFGVKDAKKEGLKGLKPGDRVTLELDEGNEIADIHKEAQVAEGNQNGADDGKGGFSPEKHRSITGTLESFNAMERKVTIKTAEGQSKSFQLKNPAISKLTGVMPGTEVVLEIDEQNRVMDAHKPS
ncbi:hypothetical protein [Candidatus Manganitrophus noduliformans]|uniref:Secreted protein n=1 Tax=Candidatus Manganitrophus noduliformans TaxID=2606439 RepID=A0A7X6DMS5_9BACT|nr:hypothetical protein [Candidatus Manganitrophus noduliformans]NKE70034.1 hypothetical protein [Candidatus Manganitrophus noduliformans]